MVLTKIEMIERLEQAIGTEDYEIEKVEKVQSGLRENIKTLMKEVESLERDVEFMKFKRETLMRQMDMLI